MAHDYRQAGAEPSLQEVLVDPIVHLVMRSDRIAMADLIRALEEARDRLRSGGSSTKAAPHAR
jgi:hypothetical protein